MKNDLLTIFINEIYSKPPKNNYATNKIVYCHIDGIWSIDLSDMIDYKISNNKGFGYIFVIIDNLSKSLWAISLKNKNITTFINDYINNIKTMSTKNRS